MAISTFDLCLLITNGPKDKFGVVGMQTDDTLIVATLSFSIKEEEKIQKAKLRSKPKITLSQTAAPPLMMTSIEFNGPKLTMTSNKEIDL